MSGNFKNFKDWQPWRRGETTSTGGSGPEKTGQPGSERGPREFVEEVKVSGQNLIAEVERLLKEGEVRRLRVKQNGKVLLDIPVAFAAVGALLAPYLAALGAIAAVVTDCTIEVVRPDDTPADRPASPAYKAPTPPAPPPTANRGPGVPPTPDDLSYR